MHRALSPLSIGFVMLTLSARCQAADPHWFKAHSPNFEIYSSAGARAIRDTLREFEQVRGFFLQVLGGSPAKSEPTWLVAFGSTKEYEPYKLNDFAIAYYHQAADRDYIVMSHSGADTFPTAVHEYVHLVVRHSGLKLPPWLNEGLAELYSTLRPIGDKILVGDLIQGRYRAMLDGKWVPLATILNADHKSPYYNEKDKAGSLYNEGWALTHMLYFRAEYRPKFGQLMRAIDSGKDSAQAFAEVYGRSIPQVEKDLQSYLHGSTFQGALVAAKLEKSVDDLPVEPLSAFDTNFVLAELNNRPGKEQAYRKALEQLIEQDAKRPEPYRSLGYLAWRTRNREEAVQYFGKAFARGDRDKTLLFDYGRLIESTDLQESIRVLWELLVQDPDRLDVRMELAENQLRDNQAQAALQTLQAVHNVTPDLATRYFRAAVYAHLRNGDERSARATAERLKAVAKTDAQREEADTLLAQVSARHVDLPQPPVEGAGVDNGRPHLQRPASDPPTNEPTAPKEGLSPSRPAVSGRFVELECLGSQARMTLETSNGRPMFLIDDPTKIIITSANGSSVELKCGRQNPIASVRVEYDPPSGSNSGIQGLVRTLTFE